jgi:DNA-binding CsgD family transcriptional regulator
MNATIHADIDSGFGHLLGAEHGPPVLRPPPLLLHTEPPRIEAHARGSVRRPSLLTALLAAESPCERHRTVRGLMQTLGFDWLACGSLVRDEAGWRPGAFCTTLIDVDWLQRYFGQRHHEVDPRWREALQSSLPCIWSLDQWSEDAATDTRFSHFVTDLRATGMQSGALLALPGRRADERWLLSLLSRTPGSAWIGDAVLGQLLNLSLCLHEFYLQHTRWPQSGPPAPAEEVLNPVQRDILLQLAHGASDKQIARELQLSPHAVDYHMRQLRRRFAARNRVQLTQAAQRLARR